MVKIIEEITKGFSDAVSLNSLRRDLVKHLKFSDYSGKFNDYLEMKDKYARDVSTPEVVGRILGNISLGPCYCPEPHSWELDDRCEKRRW
ncbi:MAG: hypothetical protein V1888_01350 [archaeon]